MTAKNHALARGLAFALVMLMPIGIRSEVFAAKQPAEAQQGFFDMSIEELMNVEVTLASKSEQRMFDTAAAVYVITAEDIRRSGRQSIPEILRMVPGVQVAHINANTWAVSIRGFNSEFANKLLVMIDGRSIYTPHFGGVYWDMHDVMLEDVERIEVIRGPGGTIWGSNAINGIINIITKKAKDTQGLLLSGTAGTEEKAAGALRYGDKISDNTYYRVYSKYFDRDDAQRTNGSNGNDDWQAGQGGFRVDSQSSENEEFTLQGDVFDGRIGHMSSEWSASAPFLSVFSENFPIRGIDLLGRWKRTFADDSSMELQLYYDRTERLEKLIEETHDTYNIDFHHHFHLAQGHEITWGLGHRFTTDHTDGSFSYSLDPDDKRTYVYSGFAQDSITLVPEKLKLTVGAKIEHNEFTGFECQPSARITWLVNKRNTAWASVTRAVRTPMRYDLDSRTVWSVSAGVPTSIEAFGNKDSVSEKVLAYELGYRTEVSEKLSLDFAGFLNLYDDLTTFDSGTAYMASSPSPHLVIPQLLGHRMYGRTYGVEASANYKPANNWKLNAGYSFLQMQLHPRSSSSFNENDIENENPHNQFHINSYYDLSDDVELDLSLNYVDAMATGDIDPYVRFDARLGWKVNKNTQLSLVGQNLLDRRHPEFNSRSGQFVTEAERAVLLKLTYRF